VIGQADFPTLNHFLQGSLMETRTFEREGHVRLGQASTFDHSSEQTLQKSQRLMETLDQINRKMGRGTLRLAAEGFRHDWKVRTDYPSPRYTTRWAELPVAYAK
jgi:hypothetical protein